MGGDKGVSDDSDKRVSGEGGKSPSKTTEKE